MPLVKLFLLSSTFSLVQAANLGDVAKNIHAPVNILFSLLIWMAALIGIFLLLSAIFQFRQHRMNPKVVPLANVIWTTLLAIMCLGFVYVKWQERPQSIKRNPFIKEKVEQLRKKSHWSMQ